VVPFLLIRSLVGDFGARPVPRASIPFDFTGSPDIIVVPAGPPNEPELVGRDGAAELLRNAVSYVYSEKIYDVWVHVWNLGLAPAYGVRVRAWARASTDGPPGHYIGGKRFDLGERSSETAHLFVKIGQWIPVDPSGVGSALANFYTDRPTMNTYVGLWATAESITDVSAGSNLLSGFDDRHTAASIWWWAIDRLPKLAPTPLWWL
jgi:hypothetical protein